MFQLAQDVRSQMKETDSGTDIDGEKNLRDLITTDKNQFSKFSAEECLRYIDLLRNDPKIEQNKKDQIEKRIWKSVQNQLKDISTNWSLKCLKHLPGCKDAVARALKKLGFKRKKNKKFTENGMNRKGKYLLIK